MKNYDHWKLQNDRDDTPFNEPEPHQDEPEPIGPCEHCGKWIFEPEPYLVHERHSGPSLHHLYFHSGCYQCPRCGTNGPSLLSSRHRPMLRLCTSI
jgi:hypothetical protein